MLMPGDMKDKRSTCGSKLRSGGLAGETRFCKGKDLTRAILSNWPPVIRNCGLNLQPSQTILSILICGLPTIKWGAGRTKIPAYEVFRDGLEPGAKPTLGITKGWKRMTKINSNWEFERSRDSIAFILWQRALGRRFDS